MKKTADQIDSAFWDGYFRSYDILNIVHAYRDLLDTAASQIDLQPGDVVLDAGAGTGNLAAVLAQKGAEVYGLDSSPQGLKIFQEKMPQGKTILHDLHHPIPIETAFFDHVYCINTLFALDPSRRQQICAELYRVLKPGGTIVMTNLLIGYKPMNVYKHHILRCVYERGFFRTVSHLVGILGPTLKMFYYNKRMRSMAGSAKNIAFFQPGEQEKLLRNAGFGEISPEQKIFANQAVLNTARKV